MKRLLSSGEVDEIDVENTSKMLVRRISINMDNGRTLGFSVDTVLKYTEVVSGGEEIVNAFPHKWWERWSSTRSIRGVQECQSKLPNSSHT